MQKKHNTPGIYLQGIKAEYRLRLLWDTVQQKNELLDFWRDCLQLTVDPIQRLTLGIMIQELQAELSQAESLYKIELSFYREIEFAYFGDTRHV